jgi:hypothetical protein
MACVMCFSDFDARTMFSVCFTTVSVDAGAAGTDGGICDRYEESLLQLEM